MCASKNDEEGERSYIEEYVRSFGFVFSISFCPERAGLCGVVGSITNSFLKLKIFVTAADYGAEYRDVLRGCKVDGLRNGAFTPI